MVPNPDNSKKKRTPARARAHTHMRARTHTHAHTQAVRMPFFAKDLQKKMGKDAENDKDGLETELGMQDDDSE